MGKEKEILELWEQAEKNRKELLEKLPVRPYDLTKQECYLEHTDTVPLIRFEAFRGLDFINAAFSTRFGGVSEGYLSELNFGFERGETKENVVENYKLFCASMGLEAKNLVLSDQVHDTKVHVAMQEDACGDEIKKKLKGIDGLLTNQPELCLATSYADCVPLFFVDGKKGVIASSHSGWRGTVERMGAKTIAAMQRKFNSQTEDIIAVIGPSICQSCYEVSQDVIDAFTKNYDKEWMNVISYCSDIENKKYQLDLWAANYLQLKEAGVLEKNIHVAGLCTCCNNRLLFSHRASKGKRGNLNGFISIRST